MTDSSDDLKQEIREWLIKSGYPLELFAYERLAEAGFFCEKSALYTDIESAAEREVDIVAERAYGDHFALELLVECKKSEKPLVVLASGPEESFARCEIYGARVYPSAFSNAAVLAELGHERGILSNYATLPFSKKLRSGYSLVQAFKNSDELFHRTLYGLAKAEHYFEKQHEDLFQACASDKNDKALPIVLHIALLVVDALLFNVFLDKGRLEIEEADWASTTLNLPWIQRPQSDRRGNIQILTKERLAKFLDELDAFARWLGNSEMIETVIKRLAHKSSGSV